MFQKIKHYFLRRKALRLFADKYLFEQPSPPQPMTPTATPQTTFIVPSQPSAVPQPANTPPQSPAPIEQLYSQTVLPNPGQVVQPQVPLQQQISNSLENISRGLTTNQPRMEVINKKLGQM